MDNLGQLICFSRFKNKKTEQEGLVRGRKPLYLSYKNNSHWDESGQSLADFSDHITAIRENLKQVSELLTTVETKSSAKAYKS